MERCIRRFRWKTFLVGLLMVFALPLALLLLVLTLVGILLLPVVFVVAIPVALVTGMSACSRMVQAAFRGGSEEQGKGRFFHVFVGTLVFMMLWTVVATLLGATGEVAIGIGYFALVVAIVLTSYPLFAGVGAAVLTRFGFREYTPTARSRGREDVEAPAPPPMPSSPQGPPPVAAPAPDRAPLRRPPRPPEPRDPDAPSDSDRLDSV